MRDDRKNPRDILHRLQTRITEGAAPGEVAVPGDLLAPPIDAWETDQAIIVEVAIPGAAPNKIDVLFEQNQIIIRGEIEEPVEPGRWLLRERARGAFERRLTLNVPIDQGNVEAHLRHGVLALKIPRLEAQRRVVIIRDEE